MQTSTASSSYLRKEESLRGKHQFHGVPLSLFAAPNMPQRQDSVSTLGSRQSSVGSLSTSESIRSLVQQRDYSLRSLMSHQTESSFRGGVFQPAPAIVEEEEPKELGFR